MSGNGPKRPPPGTGDGRRVAATTKPATQKKLASVKPVQQKKKDA